MSELKNRKIDLPKYVCEFDREVIKEGDPKCDHDYPPESMIKNDNCVHWTCSKCFREVCFGIGD